MGPNKAKIINNKDLTHNVFQLDLKSSEEIEFEAGQFITIKIEDNTPPCFRAYSINCCPQKDKNQFNLCIKIVENGRGSNWLKSLKPGDEFIFIGPNGKFTFVTPPSKSALFIATGTGLAPLKSMIEDQLGKGNTQKMHLIFGVRHKEDIFYQELLKNLSEKHSNFTYSITLSKPEEEWEGDKGRVTTILEKTNIDPNGTEVYICGLNDMIDSIKQLLTEKGMSEENIHAEKYD
jgi:ferredoxin-NADP reductase